MGNPHKHEWGELWPLTAQIVSSTYSIGVGEVLIKDAEGGVQNVSAAGWTDEATARRRAAALFAGVAGEGSDADEKDDIVAYEDGVFEYTCTSTTYNPGDLFGPEKDAGGNYLDTDVLQKVIDPTEACFYAVNRAASAATTVKVRPLGRRVAGANGRVNQITFGPFLVVSGHRSSAAGVLVSNYTFDRRVQLLGTKLIPYDGALSSEYGIVFQKNGSNVMASTSAIATLGLGLVAPLDFFSLESSSAHVFEPTDKLVIHGEGVAAGSCRLGLVLKFIELG